MHRRPSARRAPRDPPRRIRTAAAWRRAKRAASPRRRGPRRRRRGTAGAKGSGHRRGGVAAWVGPCAGALAGEVARPRKYMSTRRNCAGLCPSISASHVQSACHTVSVQLMTSRPVSRPREVRMVARILAGALLSIVSSVAWAAFPAYDMIDPQPGAPGAATDVSPNGTVVGNYSGVSGDVAWVWKNGARKDLGPGRPNAVNDAGLVGGSDQNYTTIRFWMP